MATSHLYHNCKSCSRRNNLFSCLTNEELEIVDQHRYELTFNKGEIIFKQGSPLTHVACITDGLAKLYIEGLNRRNLILSFAKPVTMIGGPGMFVDYRHHFSVAGKAVVLFGCSSGRYHGLPH